MNNKFFKWINLSLIIGLTFFSFSCDEVGGDDDMGGTAVKDMAGDWYVKTFVGSTEVLGYQLISTYNTAANLSTEMWIDDHQNIWEFKVKSGVDYSAKTFSGSALQNDYYNITVNITNGKVLHGAATTTGGNTSDSITFEAEFSDDPGTIYRIAGYKRTGFAEDEH